MIKILFVCHGNICRSVAAEYIFKNIISKKNLDNDFYCESRAVSQEELNNDIYPPMKSALTRASIPFKRHYAKQIRNSDYQEYNYIFVMDYSNLRLITRIIPNDYQNKIFLIKEFLGMQGEVEDPWYTGKFDKVIDELTNCINLVIDKIEKEIKNEN